MIAKYKSTPWLFSIAAALLMVVLAGLTFTRAADKKPTKPAAAVMPTARQQFTRLELLEQEIAKREDIIRKLKTETAELRDTTGTIEVGNTETLRKLEGLRIEAQANFLRLDTLYKQIAGKSDLRHTISAASSDTQLSELMSTLDRAEQKLVELQQERAVEHPEVKRMARVIDQINKQIDDRTKGILAGLKARMAAEEAHLKALEQALDETAKEYRARLNRSRPYEESLQKLRTEEEILQRLRLRLLEERFDRGVERGVR